MFLISILKLTLFSIFPYELFSSSITLYGVLVFNKD